VRRWRRAGQRTSVGTWSERCQPTAVTARGRALNRNHPFFSKFVSFVPTVLSHESILPMMNCRPTPCTGT
jgi:hypothetical protein